MRKGFSVLSVILLCMMPSVVKGQEMKIKMQFNDVEVIVRMDDNYAVRQFIDMLPADFEFSDFAGQEKISYFPTAIDLKGVATGMVASRGRMFIYVPWKNFGFYYKDHGTTIDKSLIPMGTIEKGLEELESQHSDFTAHIEVL